MKRFLFHLFAAISFLALLVVVATLSFMSIDSHPTKFGKFDLFWFGYPLDCDPFGQSLLARLFDHQGLLMIGLEILPIAWLWCYCPAFKKLLSRLFIPKNQSPKPRG